ncbi:MAG: hypothetical protein KDJ48_05005 [Nitratireductor sp.]|nr:hypothetical protein [Nitratireductor sp.]
MIEIVLPQSPAEWLAVIAALVTLAIGLGFFLAPRIVLARMGLSGSPAHPEAVGEGRSSFAGFLIGLPVSALLFGQPDIHAAIGLAWLLASGGKIINIVVDGARSMSVLVRLALATALAAICIWHYGLPEFAFAVPQLRADWLVDAVSAITLLFGLISLALPGTALSIMRMAPVDVGSVGEVRGALAGFYLATGAVVLGGGSVLMALALGVCWIMTGFGRMIAMLSDRANNVFNWLSLLFELGLGGLVVGVVLGFIA